LSNNGHSGERAIFEIFGENSYVGIKLGKFTGLSFLPKSFPRSSGVYFSIVLD